MKTDDELLYAAATDSMLRAAIERIAQALATHIGPYVVWERMSPGTREVIYHDLAREFSVYGHEMREENERLRREIIDLSALLSKMVEIKPPAVWPENIQPITKDALYTLAREVFGHPGRVRNWLDNPSFSLKGGIPRDFIEYGNADDWRLVTDELRWIEQGV